MSTALNPQVVNPTCECPPGVQQVPSTPIVPVSTDLSIVECFTNECGVCGGEIIPAPPTVTDNVPTSCCFILDPAYCVQMVQFPEQNADSFLVIAVDPGRGAITRGGKVCETLCEDADVLDRFSQFKVGDHEFQWFPQIGAGSLPAATVPLKFYVDPTLAPRINSELGYVILGNHNGYNEWKTRQYVESHFLNTANQPFQGGSLNLGLDPEVVLIANTIGTAPLIKNVVPFRPIARDVVDTTANDTPVTTDLAASAFSPGGGTIVPASLLLIDPADQMQKLTVVIAGVGTFDATAVDGTVDFTPESAAFIGVATVQFVISDDTPQQSNPATYSVTVAAP